MKDKRQDSLERLTHIQKAVNEIESFTLNVSKSDFIKR